MSIAIAISAIVIVYLVGFIVSVKAFDRMELQTGADRDSARARSGLFWPAKLAGKAVEFSANSARVTGADDRGRGHSHGHYPDLYV